MMISVRKLDGSTMHLNEDLIERVEDAAEGQSAIYLINNTRMIVSNDQETIVERIRTERVSLLRRVNEDSQVLVDPVQAHMPPIEVLRLTQARKK